MGGGGVIRKLLDPVSGFPDSTNTGHLRAPGYPGSLTLWNDGDPFTPGATYSFYDFVPAANFTNINAAGTTFIGCRFQSNNVADDNVAFNAAGITLSYCTICPKRSIVTAPPVIAWPSAGAGTNVTATSGYAPYQIGGQQGYQFGFRLLTPSASGTSIIEYCDIWGYGNAGDCVDGHAGPKIIQHNWIHDAANADLQEYHTDGPGYLNGGPAPSNWTLHHNTIATIGNTNGIAFQASTTAYSNISVTDNFLSGFNQLVEMCRNSIGNNNMTFTGNIFGTDLRWEDHALALNYSAQFGEASNLWRNNKLRVLPGSSPRPAATLQWNAGQDGFFVLPDRTLSATDFE